MAAIKNTLHLVTSGKQPLEQVAEIVRAAVKGGVDFVHIREKQRTAREILQWVETLAEVIPRSQIIVNDRVDVAVAAHSKGIHLAYHSLPPGLAKSLLHKDQLMGCSIHSLTEAKSFVQSGVSYLLYGHIYPSASKPGLIPRGTEELSQIVKQVEIPVIAIGGITPERTAEVMQTGCAGIAVLSGITEAPDPEEAARAYRREMDAKEKEQ